MYICPVCSGGLAAVPEERRLACDKGHSFDIARAGYVSLTLGSRSRPTGDTAAMVRARAEFLSTGLYEPIARAVTEVVREVLGLAGEPRRLSQEPEAPASNPHGSPPYNPSDLNTPTPRHPGAERQDLRLAPPPDTTNPPSYLLVDLGGGTGWYSAYILNRLPELSGVLIDASVPAATRAARAHPRLSVATADVWGVIPLRTGAADVALVVFAPRHPAEIARILAPGGTCVVVTPEPDHLGELRAVLPLGIEPDKDVRLAEQFAEFERVGTWVVRYEAEFDPAAIAAAVAMGPGAYHHPPAEAVDPGVTARTVTVAVRLSAYRHP